MKKHILVNPVLLVEKTELEKELEAARVGTGQADAAKAEADRKAAEDDARNKTSREKAEAEEEKKKKQEKSDKFNFESMEKIEAHLKSITLTDRDEVGEEGKPSGRDLQDAFNFLQNLDSKNEESYIKADKWLEEHKDEPWFPKEINLEKTGAAARGFERIGRFLAKHFTSFDPRDSAWLFLINSAADGLKDNVVDPMGLAPNEESGFWEGVYEVVMAFAIATPYLVGFGERAAMKNLKYFKEGKYIWKMVGRILLGAPWAVGFFTYPALKFIYNKAVKPAGAGIGKGAKFLWRKGTEDYFKDKEVRRKEQRRLRNKAVREKVRAEALAKGIKKEKNAEKRKQLFGSLLDLFKRKEAGPAPADIPDVFELEDVDNMVDEFADDAARADKAVKETEEALVKELRESIASLVQFEEGSAEYRKGLEVAQRQLNIAQQEIFERLRSGNLEEVSDIAKKAINSVPDVLTKQFEGEYNRKGKEIFKYTMKRISASGVVEKTWKSTAEEFTERFMKLITGGKGRGVPFLKEQEEGESNEEIQAKADELAKSLEGFQKELFESFLEDELNDDIGKLIFYEISLGETIKQLGEIESGAASSKEYMAALLQELTGESAGQQTSPDAPATAEPQTQTPVNENKIKITKSKLIDLISEQVKEQTQTVDVTKDQLVALVTQEAFKQINRKK
jgi:hypothetical protein